LKAILAVCVLAIYLGTLAAAGYILVPMYDTIRAQNNLIINATLTGQGKTTYASVYQMLDNQVSWVLGIMGLGGVVWFFLTLGAKDYESYQY
jgi:hypothetical protein